MLPAVSLVVILYTLRDLASFDVVDSVLYTLFYVLIGFAWIHFCLKLLFVFFDLSWADDAVGLNNIAALTALAGAFLGVTLIYCGANVGDGPGWWCVIFAGGLGLAAWLALGLVMGWLTGCFERVTVGRDLGCGVRTGSLLLATGIILARASAGDWTSFEMTVVEFLDGWPVLALASVAILLESIYSHRSKTGRGSGEGPLTGSVLIGAAYVAGAVASVILLPPLNENPIYRSALSAIIFRR